VSTDPLAPDIYSYGFRVDGKTFNDPANPRYIEEFGDTRTSTFSVPGALWTTTGAPAGRITQHRYYSGVIGGLETYSVYVPSDYDVKPPAIYPTLYLLHGAGDNARTWITNGGVDVTLNNLISQAKAKPMVVVLPLGYGAPDGVSRLPTFEQALLKELIPQGETAYRVLRAAEARAIAGVSMGGAQAMSIGLRHPETFGWVGAFSAATFAAMASANPSADPTRAALEPKRFALVYISCGADDSVLAPHNRQVAAQLNARGFRVTSIEVPAFGHVWPLWRRTVADCLQLVFQTRAR
jgi:enterochelin esterase-like enzyme